MSNSKLVTVYDRTYNIINIDDNLEIIRLNDGEIIFNENNICSFGNNNGIVWYKKNLKHSPEFFNLYNDSIPKKISYSFIFLIFSLIILILNSVYKIIKT